MARTDWHFTIGGFSHRRRIQGVTLAWILTFVMGIMHVPVGDGEVPCHRLTIDDAPPAKPYYKMLGDIDADGYLDIVIAGAQGPMIWYRYPDWTKHELAAGGWRGVNGEIGDGDGDGYVDITMGGVVWYRQSALSRRSVDATKRAVYRSDACQSSQRHIPTGRKPIPRYSCNAWVYS